jgi:CIC family chloride channel protein
VLSALLLKRSVLTERLARRGFHLSQEYATDPLELLLVAEVMHGDPVLGRGEESLGALRERADLRAQWLYPVIGGDGMLLGVIPRGELMTLGSRAGWPASELARPPRVTALPDETLREVAERMADGQVTTAIVLERADRRRVIGLVTAEHLLAAHLRERHWEQDRERVLRLRLPGRTPRADPVRTPPPGRR